jgi:hypothetical protein
MKYNSIWFITFVFKKFMKHSSHSPPPPHPNEMQLSVFITLLHRREAETMQSRWHDLAESRVADSSQDNPAKNPDEKQFGPCL